MPIKILSGKVSRTARWEEQGEWRRDLEWNPISGLHKLWLEHAGLPYDPQDDDEDDGLGVDDKTGKIGNGANHAAAPCTGVILVLGRSVRVWHDNAVAQLTDAGELVRGTVQDLYRSGTELGTRTELWLTRVTSAWTARSSQTPPSPRYAFRSPRAGEANDFGATIMPVKKPMQPGPFYQLALCFLRAVQEQWAAEQWAPFVVSVICLNFALGTGLASIWHAAVDLHVLGRLPVEVCSQQIYDIYQDCDHASFAGTFNIAIMTFSLIPVTVGGAAAVSTFGGASMSVYFREASAGLSTPAYVTAKVLADVPRVVASSMAFFFGLTTSFSTVMPDLQLFIVVLVAYTFGFLSGYLVSFGVPSRLTALCACAWGLLWGVSLNGAVVPLSQSESGLYKFFLRISVPRWLSEGLFDATTRVYGQVQCGKHAGEAYFSLSSDEAYFKFESSYDAALAQAWWLIGVWSGVVLLVATFSSLDKKR